MSLPACSARPSALVEHRLRRKLGIDEGGNIQCVAWLVESTDGLARRPRSRDLQVALRSAFLTVSALSQRLDRAEGVGEVVVVVAHGDLRITTSLKSQPGSFGISCTTSRPAWRQRRSHTMAASLAGAVAVVVDQQDQLGDAVDHRQLLDPASLTAAQAGVSGCSAVGDAGGGGERGLDALADDQAAVAPATAAPCPSAPAPCARSCRPCRRSRRARCDGSRTVCRRARSSARSGTDA